MLCHIGLGNTTSSGNSFVTTATLMSMEMFMVGGAVRDRLLGLPVVDRDWVVVGATPEQMVEDGYLPVGENFPVFLHPTTKEEYALARTERKTAKGYHGFTFYTSPGVTLEEDLARRDLTVNAIAETPDGRIIDPFNGQDDIVNKVLRHVSSAFSEDPVRILRIARFKARFSELAFDIAADTYSLMRSMVANGETDALVAERVWQETDRALDTVHPRAYFETLRECDALRVIFPELNALFGIPQPAEWHPEIDSGLHSMMSLDQACALSTDKAIRFAALCHDIGKADTPKSEWPKHHGHEERGAQKCKTLCARLRIPNDIRDLAVLVARHHTKVHKVFDLQANTLTRFLTELDVLRKPQRFEQFLLACEADARGRSGFQHRDYPQATFLQSAARVFEGVNAAVIAKKELQPKLIAQRIHQARVSAIKSFIRKKV